MNSLKLIEYKPVEKKDMDAERLEVARRRMKELKTKISYLKDELTKSELLYNKWKARFMKIDRKMAMKDGRFKVIEPGVSKRKESPKMSMDDILEVAQMLGINIDK